MPNPVRTEHQTFARWTLAGVQSAVGTDDAYRGGVQYEAALEADADIGEAWLDDIARGRSVSLRIRNQPDLTSVLLDESDAPLLTEAGDPLLTEFGPYASLLLGVVIGMAVTVEVVTIVTYDNNTQGVFSRTQQLTCTGRERAPGVIVLTLQDIEDERLQTLYPPRTYNTTDFPALLSGDAGRAVPRVFGTALKVPAVLIAAGPTEWSFLFAEGNAATALTVYRGKSMGDARVVPGSEYVVNTIVAPYTARVVKFFTEQRDFDGSLFQIFVDAEVTPAPHNAATVLGTVLAAAGMSVNAASLASAVAFCAAQGLMVDADFGREGQRTTKAIAEDLLWVMRSTLSRNASGEYLIVSDGAGASVGTYDEDAGDDIEVLSVAEPSRPTSVSIAYRPSPRDATSLQNTLSRAVVDGLLAPEPPRELRYVRSHGVADRCVCYRAVRAGEARLRARIYRNSYSVGAVLTISSSELGLAETTWRVREATQIPGGVEIVATPYSSALTAYVAGTLPPDATDSYEPDFSSTPPPSPTSFRITATATALQADGTLVSRVTADAVTPYENWATIILAAIHNTTGEIIMAQAADVGLFRYGTTLTGLRPGETYQLKVWAVNSYGVQGAVQGTFNATLIGGGAAVTTFNAAGYAVVPADVTGISAAQGTGKLIAVGWNAVTTANLREYVLERSVNGGAYSEIWRGQARNYVDRSVAYGSIYAYRVKARDTYGNVSTNYNTSSGVSLSTGTVVGGVSNNDIGTDTVSTDNRTAVTTVSFMVSTTGTTALFKSNTIAHGLSRVPLATVNGNTGYNSVSTVAAIDSTFVTVTTFIVEPVTKNNNSAGDPHTHNLVDGSGLPFAFSVAVDVW